MIIAICLALPVAAAGQEPRTWTAASTGKAIRATLVEQGDGFVTLRVPSSGKTSRIPISRLSEADQAYLASLRGPRAPARFDASRYRGLQTHEGRPVVNNCPLRLTGFTTNNERRSGARTFWNHLILSREANRVQQALEVAERNQLRGSGLHEAIQVAENLYEGFLSSGRGDRLLRGNEFEVAERAARVRREALPRWVTSAPTLPIEVCLYDTATLTDYDFRQKGFPISGGRRVIANGVHDTDIRWERGQRLPEMLPISQEAASRLPASSTGKRKVHVLSTVRVSEIAITGEYSTVAVCRLERIDYFLDDQLSSPVHTVRYGDADPDTIAVSRGGDATIAEAAAERASDDPLGNRMFALAKDQGLPARLGLPWYESDGPSNYQRSKTMMAEPWGKFLDRLEFSRTRDWLGLSAYDAEPVPNDDWRFHGDARQRLDQQGWRFIQNHLSPQEASRFTRMGARFDKGWRGENQFDREDVQRQFLAAYRDQIEAYGLKFPLRIVWSHSVQVSGYDVSIEGFPLQRHDPLGVISLPFPISLDQSGDDEIPVTPFDQPWRLPMDRQQARDFSKRNFLPGYDHGHVTFAYTVRIDAVEAARLDVGTRVPLVATVEAVSVYEDAELTKRLHRYEAPSHETGGLVRGEAADPVDRPTRVVSPADPFVLPALIAANSEAPFDEDGLRDAYHALWLRDRGALGTLHGYYRRRIEVAKENASALSYGRSTQTYANTEPHPELSDPPHPPRFLPVGLGEQYEWWPVDQWPDAFRDQLSDHLRDYGRSVAAIRVSFPVNTFEGEIRALFQADPRASDYVESKSDVRSAIRYTEHVAPPNSGVGKTFLTTSASGKRRHATVATTLGSEDILAQLSAEELAALSRDRTNTRIELVIDVDAVEFVPRDHEELVVLRGVPRTLTGYQVEHSAFNGARRGELPKESVVVQRRLTDELAPEPVPEPEPEVEPVLTLQEQMEASEQADREARRLAEQERLQAEAARMKAEAEAAEQAEREQAERHAALMEQLKVDPREPLQPLPPIGADPSDVAQPESESPRAALAIATSPTQAESVDRLDTDYAVASIQPPTSAPPLVPADAKADGGSSWGILGWLFAPIGWLLGLIGWLFGATVSLVMTLLQIALFVGVGVIVWATRDRWLPMVIRSGGDDPPSGES